MDRLRDQVAIIFGAGPNIGGTIAHAFAKEGAAISICDSVAKAAEETTVFLRGRGFSAKAHVVDATKPEQIESAVASTVKEFGRLDIMVNLAGRQTRFELLEMTLEQWNAQLNSYLTAAALTTQYVARAMVQLKGGGAIVHVASDAAHQGEPGNAGYCASKAAVVNFARAAAAELAHHNIRVNTISPTCMENNIFKYGLEKEPRKRFQVLLGDFLRGIPLQRLCRATDVAHAAVFLASPEASFITGVDLPLDGGARSKYWAWTPADFTKISIDAYAQTAKARKFGEVSEPPSSR